MRRPKSTPPTAKPLPVNEWLDLMLGEIDRREREEREARQENERRRDELGREPDAAPDQEK